MSGVPQAALHMPARRREGQEDATASVSPASWGSSVREEACRPRKRHAIHGVPPPEGEVAAVAARREVPAMVSEG